ncbi:MAG: hypothetical protein QXW77_00385, partial [Candidatus Hadarchaeales archaeon]
MSGWWIVDWDFPGRSTSRVRLLRWLRRRRSKYVGSSESVLRTKDGKFARKFFEEVGRAGASRIGLYRATLVRQKSR